MRSFRRIVASVGIVIGCILLVLALLFAVAQSSRVQTAAVGAFLRQLEHSLDARVAVEKVDYKFPNHLLIHGVYVEDQLGDTLLFADTLQARFDLGALIQDEKVAFRRVDLAHVKLYAHPVFIETDSMGLDSCMNYQFLVDAFRPDEEREKKPFPVRLEVKNVGIRDARIQYSDWLLHLTESSLALNHLAVDSIDAEVSSLAFRMTHCDPSVSGGGYVSPKADKFILETFRGRLTIANSQLYLPEVFIAAPQTRFHATEMSLHLGDSAFLDPSSPVSFTMREAHLSPSDMALFVPKLRSFKGYFDASARLVGRVDSLHAADLSLSYNDQRLLLGDVVAVGLPDLTTSFLKVECRDLFVNKALLQDFISNLKGQPFTLPKPVARLGDMHYRGSLQGQLHDLTLHGIFSSALGNITTNGTASVDSTLSSLAFTGDISTRRFALGKMLASSDLGNASLTVHLNGRVGSDYPFRGTVKAKVEHLRFKNYDYRNLRLDGTLHDKVFTGLMSSDDENLNLAFNGTVNFSSTPTYDFLLRLNHMRLGPLNLSKKYADSDLSFSMRLKAAGKSLDAITGALNVDSLRFTHAGQELNMRSLDLSVTHSAPAPSPDVIRLQSDYLNASFAGSYRLSTLPITFQKILIRYIPLAFSVDKRRAILASKSDNEADFYAYFHDLPTISSVLDLPVTADKTPLLKGFIHESDGQVALQAAVPELKVKGRRVEDITLNLNNADEHINLSLGALMHHTQRIASEHMGDMKLFLGAHAVADSLTVAFDWTNVDTVHNAGALRLTTAFRQYAGKPLISLHIYPTEMLLGDSLWQVNDAHITYAMADTALQVNNFSLSSASQYVRASGVASTHIADSIRVELQSIDIDYFIGALTDIHNAISFGGNVTGWATAYGIFRHPMFEADLQMLHAKINECEVGDVYASATLDKRNHVIIRGECFELFPDSVRRRTIDVDGDIGGPDHAWDLQIRPDSVRAGFIGHWVKNILTDMDGRASGQVHVWGWRKDGVPRPTTRVTVKALAHNLGFTLPFTGARYYANDSVLMDTVSILFPNMTLHDDYGNPLYLDGGVYHNANFDNLSYHFDIESDKAVVLNLPETTNQAYSGKIFATGNVVVDGTALGCEVDAAARTEAGSNVTILTGRASSASSSDFIEFISHETNSQADASAAADNSSFALNLNLMIEATPAILARVVIDPRTGDQLRGNGEGNLRLAYNSSEGGLTMFGRYILNQGTFSFTFQNVIRREFEIASGSTVTWQGDATEPIIDARAIYHLTASLRDLFGSEASQLYTNRSSVPVNCVLNLSDMLMNPTIRFGIELPSSDEVIASQVRTIINTDDMLTRQVLYLLVFNRFYTPEHLQNTQNVGLNETFSILSSTVTGQINNWLSKVTNMFTLGFNIRTDGEGAAASQEYEAQFEIQPIRGLLINGNFGYRYNDISNHPIFGNLDVEYMLTRDGKLRAKAYTHTVDKYSLRQANTVQGVGLVFKHDFNWPEPHRKDATPSDTITDTVSVVDSGP